MACPAELNIAAACHQLSTMWGTTLGAEPSTDTAETIASSPRLRREVTLPIERLIKAHLESSGATVFCDKSLSTVDLLPVVSACYPKACYLILYRHPLDMIASGVDACRWGYSGYGFEPFVTSNPQNVVAALAEYWIARTTKMLSFEDEARCRTCRLYYEVMVSRPREFVEALLTELNLDPVPDLATIALAKRHDHGPGDHKALYELGIRSDSVGSGKRVPLSLLSTNQRGRMDELLTKLEYPTLDSGLWPPSANGLPADHTIGRARTEVMSRIQRRLESVPLDSRFSIIELLVSWSTSHERWQVDLKARTLRVNDLTPEPDERLLVNGPALVAVADSTLNLGKASRDGDITFGSPPASPTTGEHILWLLWTLLRPDGAMQNEDGPG